MTYNVFGLTLSLAHVEQAGKEVMQKTDRRCIGMNK